MNSMPLIEGLSSSSNINELYTKFISDLQTFFTSYQSYINCNNGPNSQTCDKTALMNNYYALVGNPSSATTNPSNQGSMIKLQKAIAANPTNGDSVDINNRLNKLRAEFDEKAEIITNVRQSVKADYVIKQESYHYYKILISIVAGCALYYAFFEISSAK